jgi:branched-chain amino acid aminotransferase
MRTYGREIFHLDEHIDRMARSCALIDLELPWPRDEIVRVVMNTVAHNHTGAGDLTVRIFVTGGGGDGFLQAPQPRLLVFADPFTGYPSSHYEDGITAVTTRDARYRPAAKTINYIPAIVAFRYAKAQGADEALYINEADHVLEATRSNLFAFIGDTLVTPEAGILHGVTRGVVLKLAGDLFPVEVRDIELNELLAADEAFITSTSKEIMPLVKIDGAIIGDGRPGARTQELMRAFGQYVAAFRLRSVFSDIELAAREVFHVVGALGGQQVPGRLLNAPGDLVMPVFADIHLDGYGRVWCGGSGEAWVVKVVRGLSRNRVVAVREVSFGVGMAARAKDARPWVVALNEVAPEAREAIREMPGGVLLTGRSEWDELRALVGA